MYKRQELVLSIIKRCREFSAQVLVPDSIALAKFYPEWLHLGTGLSNQSLLAYGAFPSIANDYSQKSLDVYKRQRLKKPTRPLWRNTPPCIRDFPNISKIL